MTPRYLCRYVATSAILVVLVVPPAGQAQDRVISSSEIAAVVVGVSRYPPESRLLGLRSAVHDAQLFAQGLRRVGVPSVSIRLDDAATSNAILDDVRRAAETTASGGAVVFFFAGHLVGDAGLTLAAADWRPGDPGLSPRRIVDQAGGRTLVFVANMPESRNDLRGPVGRSMESGLSLPDEVAVLIIRNEATDDGRDGPSRSIADLVRRLTSASVVTIGELAEAATPSQPAHASRAAIVRNASLVIRSQVVVPTRPVDPPTEVPRPDPVEVEGETTAPEPPPETSVEPPPPPPPPPPIRGDARPLNPSMPRQPTASPEPGGELEPEEDPFAVLEAVRSRMREAAALLRATPETVPLGSIVDVVLTVSPTQTEGQLLQRMQSPGSAIDQGPARIAPRMTARLTADGASITALGSEDRAVAAAEDTVWRWHVRPEREGPISIHAVLMAPVTIAGKETPYEVRTFDATVTVTVAPTRRVATFVADNWQWLWTAVLVPVALWAFRRPRRKTRSRPRG